MRKQIIPRDNPRAIIAEPKTSPPATPSCHRYLKKKVQLIKRQNAAKIQKANFIHKCFRATVACQVVGKFL